MGAGKSHVINWMSEKGFFPLPDIVQVYLLVYFDTPYADVY
jgi:hypothetical protein